MRGSVSYQSDPIGRNDGFKALFALELAAVGGIMAGVGGEMAREERLDKKSVPELVKLYGASKGGQDAVGPELKRRGAAARDEVIRMLDAIPEDDLRNRKSDGLSPAEAKMAALVDILRHNFPSKASYQAIERFEARFPNCRFAVLDDTLARMRAEMNHAWNEAWQAADHRMSPAERNLHYVELLLANCRAKERVHFLAQAGDAALWVVEVEEAHKSKNVEEQGRPETVPEESCRLCEGDAGGF